MATAVITLIIEVLKLVQLIISSWIAWSMEERKLFEERVKIMSNLLKDAAQNKKEAMNEASYLSNLDWEKRIRFQTYRDLTYSILVRGRGIDHLSMQTSMGMGSLVQTSQSEVVKILITDFAIDEKSKLIGKLLVEKSLN